MVLNPAVLRQNNNYPFKTTCRHVWYIALEEGQIEGFVPVNVKETGAGIDNYYIRGDNDRTIDRLLECVTSDKEFGDAFTAVVHKRHVTAFRRNGFRTFREWKNYDKMDYHAKERHIQAAECV